MFKHAISVILHRPGRFLRECRGSVSVETVIVMPMLILALGMVVLLSGMFRSQTVSTKAAYTISDTLSRRVDPVDAAYLDGLAQLHRYLSQAQHDVSLRVSSVAFDVDADEYFVIWSYNPSGDGVLTTETINLGIDARLPTLATGETLILVEAGTQWRSFLPQVLADRDFNQIVFTRPRFTPQLRFDTGDLIISLPGGGTCDDGGELCNTGS